ncbi:hypothetical protein [Nostoc linckia]|nr:hypothetical protein [Nostoc linckia]
MGRWGDEGVWGEGEMGRWGDEGVWGVWGVWGEREFMLPPPSSHTSHTSHTSCLPNAQCPMPNLKTRVLFITITKATP